jgi:hypothetical protein
MDLPGFDSLGLREGFDLTPLAPLSSLHAIPAMVFLAERGEGERVRNLPFLRLRRQQ